MPHEGLALLLLLGSLAGILSGLVGIGGGIIMVPLLLYLPPLIGSRLSQRLSQTTLRRILAVVVIATALRMGGDLLLLG